MKQSRQRFCGNRQRRQGRVSSCQRTALKRKVCLSTCRTVALFVRMRTASPQKLLAVGTREKPSARAASPKLSPAARSASSTRSEGAPHAISVPRTEMSSTGGARFLSSNTCSRGGDTQCDNQPTQARVCSGGAFVSTAREHPSPTFEKSRREILQATQQAARARAAPGLCSPQP